MPVSPAKWSPFARSEVQQVYGLSYGIKRKTTPDEEQQSLNDCLASAPEFARKRMRLWSQQELNRNQSQQPVADNLNVAQEQRTDMVTMAMDDRPDLYQQTLISKEHATVDVQHPVTTPQSQQHLLSMDNLDFQSGMVMNINTDDDAMDEEYAAACDAMDGEGAVDASQYGGRVQNQHESHCFGAEQSPNSGRARCYCRPTWDTMMSNNSFCSDIY